MKKYGLVDERTPLTKTLPTDYVYMTNPNRMYRKQVHQFQCCICAIVLAIFGLALVVTVLYSVDNDDIDVPDLPRDNASLQLLLSKTWPLPDAGVGAWQGEAPTPQQLAAAVAAGKAGLAAKDAAEKANSGLPVSSPSYKHQASIKTSPRAANLARPAYVMEQATKQFLSLKTKLKNDTKTVGRGPMLTTDWLPTAECGGGPLPPCPPSEYRTVDGSCNNPYKPTMWGVAMRPYRRQLPPDYADGISKPRVASDGSPLPSAREVSVTVHRPVYRDDPNFTVMLAVWGQFMDHDVTATASSIGAGGKPISCCQNTSAPVHPECFPVYLKPDDPYYQQFGVTCMEFVRSAPAPTCSMGPREQMNQVSSFLDASVVYGNTAELSRSLRSFQGGQLKMLTTPDGRTLLPVSTNLEDGCNREAESAKGKYCFMTGDARANENTHLTSLHLLMARQHNLIASSLADLNPDWSDETLYQEARKILAAQMQHITFNEFLPVLLGPDLMDELELNPQEEGYYKGYSPYTDPTISNNFATSAFRFAHTLLPALMKTVAKDWASEESIEMHKMLFDPFKLYNTGALDKVLQGAINTQLERADTYFNTEFTQKLFQATPGGYGLDLVSLNIQRGRDHGLPPYPQWREFCGLSRPKTFEDMVGMVDPGSLESIKTLYKSVEDIDVYTGSLSEFPIEGGIVGPTITCLVADQFKRMKQGDSFWYETDRLPQAFSASQLNEIRKTSLAGLICDTSDEVTTVQQQVMKSVSATNLRVPCSSLPRPDLTKWASPSGNQVKLTPGVPVKPKSVRITATVTSGSIKTTSGEVLWDGTLPVDIPLPLGGVPLKKAAPGISAFGEGAQWEGVVTTSPDSIDVSGTFSYPIYTHGPIPLFTNFSFTPKWVNGEFKFSMMATTNDTDLTQLSLPGSYESAIYFSEAKTVPITPTKQFNLGAAADDSPLVVGVQKLPLILSGSYSALRTDFFWSGNATIVIPAAVIAPPALSEVKPGPGAKAPSTSGAFTVIGGSMKVESTDGSSSVVWNGEVPKAIPIPMPYKVVSAAKSGQQYPILGSGVVWSGSISGNSIEGSFSFPEFNRTLGFLYVDWISGEFSVQVVPLMLNASLDQLLMPGIKYTSRIILREDPTTVPLQMNDVLSSQVNTPGSIEDLIVESQEVIDGIVQAPLILHGTFSPDKTTFNFNGNIILAVKPTTPKLEKQLQLLKSPVPLSPIYPSASASFGGIVNSGHLSAGLDGASPSTVWTGTLPVAIPSASFFSPIFDSVKGKSFLFGNGAVWSGTLSGSTIKGTFSLPQTTWAITGITQQVWAGEFEFEVSPLWAATLDTMFVQGAKYYSKINFQGSKSEPGLSSFQGVPGEDPTVSMAAPIMLQGVYSLDKKTFYWSGGFIIQFRNKPAVAFKLGAIKGFTVPTVPDLVKPKWSIEVNVAKGNIVGGFVGDTTDEAWSGYLPATIPFSNLISSSDTWRTVPTPNIMWSGEVVNGTFKGMVAVPTYKQNGTSEMIVWWAGNFTFLLDTTTADMLGNYVKAGKKYNFDVFFQSQKSLAATGSSGTPKDTPTKLLKFTQAAQTAVGGAKTGKLVLYGKYWSKPFYCYVLPFCDEKNEFYWNGGALLVFPNAPKVPKVPKAPTTPTLQASAVGAAGMSSQFGGKVVSGSVSGGIDGGTKNVWWTGTLPVNIPTSIFWTNKTTAAFGLIGGRSIEWSGSLTGNTLKGTFSFPQLVQNFPVPTVQYWSGDFSFDIEPLWNTSLVGLIESGVNYSSGIHFQGVKLDDNAEKFVLVSAAANSLGLKMKAPIILQGTLSPDGSSFLWSGDFIIAVSSFAYPFMPYLGKSKTKPPSESIAPQDPSVPSTPTTPKPKMSVSFTVITGEAEATNGSEAVTLWGGEMPLEINTDLLNPTNTPGGGVSVTWSPLKATPTDLSGTFSVNVYARNGSIIKPVHWTGNFSFHYLIKWSGSLDTLVKPGSSYSCSLVFKEPTVKKSMLKSPGFLDDSTPKQFILGDSPTACSLILTGKSYLKNVNPFYCNLIPFMCPNKPATNWFSFTGDALLVLKPTTQMAPAPVPTPMPSIPSAPAGVIRQINASVISGSIEAAPEPEMPETLWSGSFPLNVSLPVFWDSEDSSNSATPPGDEVNAHGVIWSGYQMGPRIEGSFSLPQYSKTGMKWWTGRFNFLLQTNWGMLGDLDSVIQPNINYNSRIIFRDIHTPLPLLTPTQFDVDTATKMPIILLGTYSSDRKMFSWSGNVIIGIRYNPWNLVSKSPSTGLKPVTAPKPVTPGSKPVWPMTPGTKPIWPTTVKPTRVGVLVTEGSLTNGSIETNGSVETNGSTDGNFTTLWSGAMPAPIPVDIFNVTKGANVIWTASTLTPKFTGNYSIPIYMNDPSGFKVQWLDGEFSFDLTPLWTTTMDVIEVGKQYATVVFSNATKLTKADKATEFTSIMDLIMDSAALQGSQLGTLSLKGSYTPDNMTFNWMGEAWFTLEKNKTVGPTTEMLEAAPVPLALQFGGSVYDGWVTVGSSGFFSFSSTLWSGTLPAEIPMSSLWSKSLFGGSKFARGITWQATSVTDSIIAGSFSVPQISWDNMGPPTVTYYTGEFQFKVKPLWNATLTSLVQPGMQYSSQISFQGTPPGLLEDTSVSAPGVVPAAPGIKAPILLQGTYSPDFTSFYWSGNFIISFKTK